MRRFNNNMIVLAREARSLNQSELAGKVNMSPTNLSKIERGEVNASEELIAQIGEVTGFPFHFFSQEGHLVPEHLAYRKRHHVARRLIVPINAKANILRKHVQFLTRQLDLGIWRPPMRWQVDAAETLRSSLGLKGPIEDMCRLVESLGIPVLRFDFDTDRVDSRSLMTDDGYPVIFVNSRLSGDRQRFSVAFELACVLDRNFGDGMVERDLKHEANAFAASLLMPEEEIRQDLAGGITLPLLATMKRKWKVSMISVLYRADDLGLISANQKRYLLQQFNEMQIRRREPIELDFAAEEPHLVRSWIQAYCQRHRLGVIEMAALFCLHPDEFLELYS